MVVVITRVTLKPGRVDQVLELFQRTNPDLVAEEQDWLRAQFTANRTEDRVAVLAYWNNAQAYRTFSRSDKFQQVMSAFAPHFAAPPEVTVQEVLFEM